MTEPEATGLALAPPAPVKPLMRLANLNATKGLAYLVNALLPICNAGINVTARG
jgi:hypothetical protein